MARSPLARAMSPITYDRATDEFCRALGLQTERVTHLAVGPNFTVARVLGPGNVEQTVRIGRDGTRVDE